MEMKVTAWVSIEECEKDKAVAIFKDIRDNLGNIIEYKEPDGSRIEYLKVANNSVLKPSETYENNIKPKPSHIPDFNWDIKV